MWILIFENSLYYNNRYNILNGYDGPEIVLNALPVSSDLILTILWSGYYASPYFTDEETEVGIS